MDCQVLEDDWPSDFVHHSIILELNVRFRLEEARKAKEAREKAGKRNETLRVQRMRESPRLAAWPIPQVPRFLTIQVDPFERAASIRGPEGSQQGTSKGPLPSGRIARNVADK